jgi:putative peptide zinc metalloprotease protein
MNGTTFDFASYQGLDQEFRLDTLEQKQTYLLIDINGTHIRLTPSAYALLTAARSGIPFDRLAQTFNSGNHATASISAQQLAKSYEGLVSKLQAIQKSGSEKQRLPWGFWARLRLLPQPMVRSIASRLTFLYTPGLAAILVPVIIASLILSWFAGIKLQVTASSLACSYALFLLSLLIHEFGHATASQRYGAEPSEIGFAMYLVYPALYSDVTSAWRLSRWKRVMVDVGGSYFQLIVGCFFLALFKLTGWQPLWAAFLMIIYTCIFSLNPIFKFDGYWVAADILGVTNLSKQPSRLVKHFWNVIRKRAPEPLPWPKSVVYILIVYSAASCAVWGSFFYRLAPLLYLRTLRFEEQLASLYRHISFGSGTSWGEFGGVLGSLYVLAILGVSVYQLSKRAIQYVYTRIMRPAEAQPGQRLSNKPIHPTDSGLGGMNAGQQWTHLSDGE